MRTRPILAGVAGWREGVDNELMSARLEDVLRLSVPERVQLVEDIRDSIAAAPSAARPASSRLGT